jgi:hypothetical protein
VIAFLSSSRRRWVGLLSLALVVAALLSACGSQPGGEHPANAGKAPQIDPTTADSVKGVPVITDKVELETQAPIGELKVVPRNTEVIYACVQIDGDLDDRFSVRWYRNGQHLTNLDSELVLSDFAISGWASFPIANSQPWATGTYVVEIYYMEKLAGVTTFTVK